MLLTIKQTNPGKNPAKNPGCCHPMDGFGHESLVMSQHVTPEVGFLHSEPEILPNRSLVQVFLKPVPSYYYLYCLMSCCLYFCKCSVHAGIPLTAKPQNTYLDFFFQLHLK